MQSKPKEAYLQRFFKAEVKPKNATTVVHSNGTVNSSVKCLSVSFSQCDVTKIPFENVEVIYSNAEKVLMKHNWRYGKCFLSSELAIQFLPT